MRSQLRWRSLTLAVCVVALALAVPASAGDKEGGGSPDHKALDGQVFKALRDVINKGADLYNSGDQAGCYRLYEGALMSIEPLLAHKPKLQEAVKAGLARAAANPNFGRRAFDLRAVIDQVRNDTNPNPPTLWTRLGGEANVKKVIDDFVALAAPDPKVDFFRGGKVKLDAAGVANLKKQLLDQISSVSGGPYKYTGRSMKEVHAGMGITEAQFNALAGHLITAMKKNGAAEADINAVIGVIATTKGDIVEGAGGAGAASLWDRLGGEKGVTKVIEDFVTTAGPDPKVNFDRGGKVKVDGPALIKSLVAFVSSATGGPIKYTGKSMKEAHKGMGITKDEFIAIAGHLKAALEKNGVKPEDVDAVMKAAAGTAPDIIEEKPEAGGEAKLWDRLGGEAAVTKVVKDFIATAGPDPKVNFLRNNTIQIDDAGVAKLEKSLVAFVSMAAGGPIKYEGKSMKDAHKGMKITDAEFDAIAGHLQAALEKNGVKPDDVKAVMTAVGGTRKDIVGQ